MYTYTCNHITIECNIRQQNTTVSYEKNSKTKKNKNNIKNKQLVLKWENKFDLKMKKEVMDFKVEGSLLQTDGALNLNDLQPISL